MGRNKKRFFTCILVLWVVAAALCPTLFGQLTGSIRGTVTDETGAVLPGAQVTVTNLQTGEKRVVATDDTGRFQVFSLASGRYELRSELPGFKTEIRSPITLAVGGEVTANLTLQIGDISEEVLVQQDANIVSLSTTQTEGLVGERQVKDLPLNGRSVDNLITLNASSVDFTSNTVRVGSEGAGNLFTVSGRRFDQNLFLIDGIEFTGAGTNNVQPGGASGQFLGIDAVREFNVLKDTYSPEFGKRPGAQVNIVTMSGGQTYHGSAFWFHRNSALDARNFFDLGEGVPPFVRNNFGGSIGGPIVKDKTYFFFNGEFFRERQGLSSVAFVPDENARLGLLPDPENPGQLIDVGLAPGVAPFFALFPSPNGRNFGDGRAELFSNPNRVANEDFYLGRIDHHFSDYDKLSGTYIITDGDRDTPTRLPTISQSLFVRNQLFALSETHTFSANATNTARFGFSRARFNFSVEPVVDLPPELSFVQGRPVGDIRIGGGLGGIGTVNLITATGAPANDRFTFRNLFTWQDTVELIRGRHTMSFGVWFQRIQTNQVVGQRQFGAFLFNELEDFLRGDPAVFAGTLNPGEVGVRQLLGAGFFQDKIQVTSNLTVDLGLRFEASNGINENEDRASNFVFGTDGILQTQPLVGGSALTENNMDRLLSPRIGLAWDPFGNGKTVIRAGAGIHYQLPDSVGFTVGANPRREGNTVFNAQLRLPNPEFPLQLEPGPLEGAVVPIAPLNIQSDLEAPTVASWRLRIAHALTSNTEVSAAYIGSRGYHLMTASDVNTAIPEIRADGTKFIAPGTPRRNPALASTRTFRTNGDSYYHAFEAEVRQRMSHGLSYRANLTVAKSIDNAPSVVSVFGVGEADKLLDPDDPARDRGLSPFDIRKAFTFNAIWELPIGRGQPFLNNSSGAVDKLVSGWQVNTIIRLQDGFPFTPRLGFNQSRNGDTAAPDRPNLLAPVSGIETGDPQQFFDPTVFGLPEAGTFGNAGRNILTGPGLATVDLALFKTTSVNESFNVQFRFEAFNIFNRTNFGLPNTLVLDQAGNPRGSAGRITSTSTSSRQLQFGLKLNF